MTTNPLTRWLDGVSEGDAEFLRELADLGRDGAAEQVVRENEREREFLLANIAACDEFISELPATRVIERHGFEIQREQWEERLRALDEVREP